jgi:hypothetical protein
MTTFWGDHHHFTSIKKLSFQSIFINCYELSLIILNFIINALTIEWLGNRWDGILIGGGIFYFWLGVYWRMGSVTYEFVRVCCGIGIVGM